MSCDHGEAYEFLMCDRCVGAELAALREELEKTAHSRDCALELFRLRGEHMDDQARELREARALLAEQADYTGGEPLTDAWLTRVRAFLARDGGEP